MFAPDNGGDAFGSCLGGVHGGQIRNLLVNGGLAQVGVVVLALLARRGVDDQVDFPVDNGVVDIGAAFLQLFQDASGNAVFLQIGAGAPGRHDGEAQFMQLRGGFQSQRPVGAVDADQSRAG